MNILLTYVLAVLPVVVIKLTSTEIHYLKILLLQFTINLLDRLPMIAAMIMLLAGYCRDLWTNASAWWYNRNEVLIRS